MDKVLIVCGIISTIIGTMGAITGVITYIYKPFKAYKELQNHSIKVNEILNKQNATDQILCTCMLAILQNLITGNSIDNLKKTRDEMQEYLIKK